MRAETTYSAVLGIVLQRKRKKLGLTSAQMAQNVGVSVSAWSRIERGDGSLSTEQLNTVASIYKERPGDILDEIDVVCKELQAEEIEVHNKKSKAGTKRKWGLALLGLGALSAIVGAVLSENSDDDSDKKK